MGLTTKERIRTILLAIGLLDLLSFYRSFYSIQGILKSITVLNTLSLVYLFQILVLGLVISLPISGLLTIMSKKSGLLIYYFQFPIKLAFVILTFGFVPKLFNLQIGSTVFNVTMGLVVGLEALRLGGTVYIHRTYFKSRGEAANPQHGV